MFRRSPLVILLVATFACGGGDDDGGPSETPPEAPAQNDPAFTIQHVRSWYLISNDATQGHDELLVQVLAPEGVGVVDVWIDGQPGIRLAEAIEGFAQQVDISDLGPGEHEILLAADGSDTAFARLTFLRSHPLYILVSNDWDDPDNSAASLALQEELHAEHPELRMTHFVGPYTFTDPYMPGNRMSELVEWVTGMRDTYDDEIGLHIHPYCSFVEAAGLTCKTTPTFGRLLNDASGYSVLCSAYDEAEFTTLVQKADEIFEANGLGKPTSFRAGGWSAELSTLRALANVGYIADTSANHWALLEEEATAALFAWNQEHWSSMNATSQPYYPSQADIQVPGDPDIPVLEVPDNASLVDYVSAEEMIAVFDANWAGGALEAPVAYSLGYHPSNFDEGYKARLTEALSYAEQFLAATDGGPAVYGTLSEMPLVWPH